MIVSGGTVSAGRVSQGLGARRRARPTVTAVLLGVLTVAGLTACGASSSDSATASSAAAGTEKASAATGVTTTTGAAAPAGAKAGGSSNASDLGKQLVAAFNAAAKGDCTKGPFGDDDAAGVDAQPKNFLRIVAWAEAMKDLSSSGPSEIRSDLKIVADAFGALVAVYQKYGITDMSQVVAVASDPAKMAEVSAAMMALQDPKVVAASAATSAWAEKKCPGMNLGKG